MNVKYYIIIIINVSARSEQSELDESSYGGRVRRYARAGKSPMGFFYDRARSPAFSDPSELNTCVCFCFRCAQHQRQQKQQPPFVGSCPDDNDHTEGEDQSCRRRCLTAATAAAAAVPPPYGRVDGGGGRSSAANPTQVARTRTRRTDDSHAAVSPYGPATAAVISAEEFRRRRYGMYAAASSTSADARYGLRYGLSSSLASQDPKASAAAAFFLRLVRIVFIYKDIKIYY